MESAGDAQVVLKGHLLWAATPISMGHPGWTLAPLVVGPSAVPMVRDEVARAREAS